MIEPSESRTSAAKRRGWDGNSKMERRREQSAQREVEIGMVLWSLLSLRVLRARLCEMWLCTSQWLRTSGWSSAAVRSGLRKGMVRVPKRNDYLRQNPVYSTVDIWWTQVHVNTAISFGQLWRIPALSPASLLALMKFSQEIFQLLQKKNEDTARNNRTPVNSLCSCATFHFLWK